MADKAGKALGSAVEGDKPFSGLVVEFNNLSRHVLTVIVLSAGGASADQRRHDEQPNLCKRVRIASSPDNGRTERSGWVH